MVVVVGIVCGGRGASGYCGGSGGGIDCHFSFMILLESLRVGL